MIPTPKCIHGRPWNDCRQCGTKKDLMKMLMLLVLFAGCGGWTKQDTLAEIAFATPTAADWVQTNGITSQCRELNSIIGACGENISPTVYFPTAIVLHAAVAAILPRGSWRRTWQLVGAGAEVNQVWANYSNHVTDTPPLSTGTTSSGFITHPASGPNRE